MNYFNINTAIGGSALTGIILLSLWSLFWKGLALWHAAHRKEKKWFIVILVLNTMGILDLIYLFLVVKVKFNKLW